MVDGRNFFDQTTKMIQKHLIAISIIKDFNQSKTLLSKIVQCCLLNKFIPPKGLKLLVDARAKESKYMGAKKSN